MRILSMKRARCAIPPSRIFGLRGYCCIVVTLLSSFSGGWRRAGARAERSDLLALGGASTSGLLGDRTRSTLRLSHRTRLMKGLQLPICLHDHGEFTHHVRNVRTGDRIVTLVVPQSGVHAVADAAEARGRPPGLQGFR